MINYLPVYIINFCNDNDLRITNLRLNQIMYCIYVVFNAKGEQLFKTDFVSHNGYKIIPDLYARLRYNGALHIWEQKEVWVFKDSPWDSYHYLFNDKMLSKKYKKIVHPIILMCSRMSIDDLSYLVNLPQNSIANFFNSCQKTNKRRRFYGHR